MKKVLVLLIIGLVFYLSSLAYEKTEASKVSALEAQITTLKAENGKLGHDVAVKDIEFAAKDVTRKSLLKLLFPSGAEQIDKVFGPEPAPTPEKVAAAPVAFVESASYVVVMNAEYDEAKFENMKTMGVKIWRTKSGMAWEELKPAVITKTPSGVLITPQSPKEGANK